MILSLGAILLAWTIYWVDSLIPNYLLKNSCLILAGTPGELRSSLLGMASTILTTAGIVFTLLTIPLSTVVAQFGSRLLRVFLGDRTSQLVLGMFTAAFVYCIAAVLSIPTLDIETNAPQITSTVGLLLMLGTFASLILLVQHISTMLQALNIAAAAGTQMVEVIQAELTEVNSDESLASMNSPETLVDADGYPLRVNLVGYIQYIDPETVITVAREKDLMIEL